MLSNDQQFEIEHQSKAETIESITDGMFYLNKEYGVDFAVKNPHVLAAYVQAVAIRECTARLEAVMQRIALGVARPAV